MTTKTTDHRTSWVRCPACLVRMDGALNTTGPGGPEPGDASVCGYCATILVYTYDDERGLGLRLATKDEILEFFTWPEFVQALYAVRALLAERAKLR